jgi:hypothetical protein
MESRADKIIEQIAREQLRVETLQERGLDRLDFHEVSVASIKQALMEAFDAGFKMCAEARG